MNLTQTHLRMVRDSLIAYRRSIVSEATPIGRITGNNARTERSLTPAIQHKLNEITRIINFLDSEMVDSSSDDTWTLDVG